jgi:chloride channel protein, CIC family
LWALLGMAAMLAGALGVPLTAVLFALELTHALPAILPLALACAVSYLVTALIMPRSILTEKLSRRGYHLSREYGVDPLETVSVAEVMSELTDSGPHTYSKLETLPEVFAYSDETCRSVAEEMAANGILTMLVVERATGMPCGSISATELLAGRKRSVQRELERSSIYQFR